jgi:hypothetical protein
MTEKLGVMDDWVIDTFGKDFVNKLMDRGEHHCEFIEPVNCRWKDFSFKT